MSSSHDNQLKLRFFRRLKSYIATFSRTHLCVIPPTLVGWLFKSSSDVIKVIYTTNAIESLNSTYRKLNRQRSVFPSDTALLKALYLATFEATKKWSMPLRNCGKIYRELSLMYEERVPQ